jgi:hypothetical protein
MSRLALALLYLAAIARGERWRVQYFYDQDRETLVIEDIACPSARRCIAVGTIIDQHADAKKPRFTTLVTSDAGEHWAQEPLKEHPRSIFFLNESLGWMVTDNAIWFTEESGRTWKKIADQKKPDKKIGFPPPGGLITSVWFLSPERGFAAGLQKSVFETTDGGRTWNVLAAAAEPSANPAHSAYTRISFDGSKRGVIIGSSIPPRGDDPRYPTWMQPERASRRRQIPTLTFLIETTDGGATWKTTSAPLMGQAVSVSMADLDGLLVFSYTEASDWPSEVYRLQRGSKANSTSVFRAADRRVTDCKIFSGPRAFLAAVEPPGKLNTAPIPGRVKILTSSNLTDWTEMAVDRKAVARALVLAGPDPEHMWAATDTGMILQLVP